MQGNEKLKKRQMLSAQIDLSKFNKGDFIKATEEEKKQQDEDNLRECREKYRGKEYTD